MTTVSRQQTVTTSSVTGGGDWDHRLNRLLEDLQGTVTPPENQQNVSEFREYRTYSSTKKNDEPAQTSSEKWVEYGTQGGGGSGISQRPPATAYSSSNQTRERTVNFSDDILAAPAWPNDSYSSTTNKMSTQMDFRQPSNAITVLKPGPSSPLGSSTEPKVERKEFYAKASYTSLIKGSGGPVDVDVPLPGFNSIDTRSDRLLEDFRSSREPLQDIPRPSGVSSSISESRRTHFTEREPVHDIPRPSGLTSSISETRRTHFSENTRGTTGVPFDSAPPAIGPPLYSSTPLKSTQSSYIREVINDRSVTPPPPPSQGLKTPPLVRKILQSSTASHQHLHSNTSSTIKKTTTDYDSTKPICARPPLSSSPGIPNYDEPPQQTGARYYTSTTTRTEHRENRDLSPVRVFPSAQPPRDYNGEPPQRLDDLMATFEGSYTETRRIHGDGGGPHQSHPYGPGTHSIAPVRQVRIDDNITQRTISVDEEPGLHQRKNATNYQNPSYQPKEAEPTRNVAGPPVYYPSNQVFPKTEEEAQMAAQEGGKGKMKAQRKADYKAKEKMKSSHDESKGSGVVPIPVCLPVCCAAPCTIM